MNSSVVPQRYFDRRIGDETVFVLPGNHFVQKSGESSISTLLGSCVSACIRDTASKAGGLNHFLLPDQDQSASGAQSSRYGVHAMEVLINDLLKLGALKSNLEAKIFGGSSIIKTTSEKTVGSENCDFVRDYLQSESIKIMAEDVGGSKPRRIYFFPASGKVTVLSVDQSRDGGVQEQDIAMRERVLSRQKTGGVELF